MEYSSAKASHPYSIKLNWEPAARQKQKIIVNRIWSPFFLLPLQIASFACIAVKSSPPLSLFLLLGRCNIFLEITGKYRWYQIKGASILLHLMAAGGGESQLLFQFLSTKRV